jgi:hypothetical protein
MNMVILLARRRAALRSMTPWRAVTRTFWPACSTCALRLPLLALGQHKATERIVWHYLGNGDQAADQPGVPADQCPSAGLEGHA